MALLALFLTDSAEAQNANRLDRAPESLRTCLTLPHPPMPNLNLSNREISDIGAYLQSLRERASLRDLFLRYIGAFEIQLAQSVACNSLHNLEAHCARWLLMTHDRARCDTFTMTHEFLAEMLGAYRPTVSVVAGKLRAKGLIRYGRGKVTILDRKGQRRLMRVLRGREARVR